jgi:hypothetical protein
MIRALTVAMALAAAGAAAAQDDAFRIGDDVFRAGTSVVHDEAGIDDLFAAGERVEVAAPITGTAWLTGRRVTVDAEVGSDLYAAGADLSLGAPVAGDANLAGYDVTVDAPVGEALRAAARHLRVAAPVVGTALIAAKTVEIDAAIAGDATIAAETITFGEGAAVGGRLVIHDDPDRPTEVPASVAPADRVERRALPVEARDAPRHARGWLAIGRGVLFGALFVAVLATLAASIAPRSVERLYVIADERPFRTLAFGFLALAALIGAAVLLVMTLIGIVVAPVVLIAAVALAVLGYVLAVYLAGRAVWDWIGQLPPDTFWERALAALIGAVLVGLVSLVPFIGWLVLLALTLIGLGALTVAALRPEFRP